MRFDLLTLTLFGISGGSMIARPAFWRRCASGKYGWLPKAWWARASLLVYQLVGMIVILEGILLAAIMDGHVGWPRFLHYWQLAPR
jgi:hypothetical protein